MFSSLERGEKGIWSRCEITSGNRILSQILVVWILTWIFLNFFPSFIEFKIIIDCTGYVGLGQSPLPRLKPFCVLLCRFSLVNFMYIVLQIFYPLLFPSIKRVIFIHNKLIIILTCSNFTCPSIWMAVDWKGFQSLLEMIE